MGSVEHRTRFYAPSTLPTDRRNLCFFSSSRIKTSLFDGRTPKSARLYNARTPEKSLMHIASIMSRVQECPWQSFKMGDIVTMERCLQELCLQDPRINILLRKLSNECVFEVPAKKQQHLKRTRNEEQQDNEFKRYALDTVQQINNIDEQISFYKTKLDECSDNEREMRLEMIRLDKSIQAVTRIYELLRREFNLLLERVYHSFDESLSTLELIPKYMQSISESKLVKQVHALPLSHREQILKYTRNTSETIDLHEIRYIFMDSAATRLSEHMRHSASLLRDLTLIVKLYTTELAVEQDHLKALEGHIDYLRGPID